MRNENIIVGLDIGTTKICAVVGEVNEAGINIIGVGSYPSEGLRKGVVVDIDAAVGSIKRAVEEAELMAGCEISSVYAGIAGGHISGINSHGIIAIKGNEITPMDVDRVEEAARAIAIPMDREVIHVLTQEYAIDGQEGIYNPIGMAGVRLEAKVHIITGAVTSAHNIVKCATRAGLDVRDIVLESLAAGEAVLSEEEKEIGTALIDLGGGTTDITVFGNRSIRHSFALALGGQNLTNDLAVGIQSSLPDAERIKTKYGTCSSSRILDTDTVEVPGIGGRGPRKMNRQMLSEILQPRVEEIFQLLYQDLQKAGLEKQIASGVVLTGGTAMLDGIIEVAESVFNRPTRLGGPQNIRGMTDIVNSPLYATGVGLVMYGARNQGSRIHIGGGSGITAFNKITERMRRLFRDIL